MFEKFFLPTSLRSGCGMQSIADRLSGQPEASFLLPYFEVDNETYVLLQVTPERGLHMLGGKNKPGEDHVSCLSRKLPEKFGKVSFSSDEIASFPHCNIKFNVKGEDAEATVVPVLTSFAFVNSLIKLTSLEHPLVFLSLSEYFEGWFAENSATFKMSEVTQHALCAF